MLKWISKDGRSILAARIIRTFGYGFLSVILSIYLALIGFNGFQVGLILSASLINSVFFNLIASFYADKIGRRRLLILYSLLMFLSGIIFFITDKNYAALILAAFIGTLNVTGSETSAFLSIEQAILPRTIKNIKMRNTLYASYNMVGTFAMSAGILLSGLPDIIHQSYYGLDLIGSMKLLFLLYGLLGLVNILIYLRLSVAIEVSDWEKRSLMKSTDQAVRRASAKRKKENLARNRTKRSLTFKDWFYPSSLSGDSKQIITKLSGLFAIDSFAGGFVIQSIVSLWFYTRFEADLSIISYILSISGIITAFSFLGAARIADRIGLVNTMVFTHLPSNILIILVALAPTLPVAAILYFVRTALSQMDVPTRQSYIVSVVRDEERTTATSTTNISRNISQVLSPSFAAYLLQGTSFLFAPFLIGGLLKVTYDILLYFSFRNVKPQQEK